MTVFLKHLRKGGDLSAKRSGGDVAGVRLLRRLLTAADDEERCGPNVCNMLRRAKAVFEHIKTALQQPDAFRGGTGTELCTLLQKQMLNNTAYCQSSHVSTFTVITDHVMAQIEVVIDQADQQQQQQKSERQQAPQFIKPSEELQRLSAVVLLLLQQMPGVMTPLFAREAMAFVGKVIDWMNRQNEHSKAALPILQALQHLMLTCGHALRGDALMAPASFVQVYMRRAWREARLPRFKEALVAYCRAALRLGVLQRLGPVAMTEVQQLVLHDLTADDFAWETEGGQPGAPLVRHHSVLAALAGDLFHYHQLHHHQQLAAPHGGGGSSRGASPGGEGGAGGGDDDEDDEEALLPRKRARAGAPIGRLVDLCSGRPARWGPPMAALLRQHGVAVLIGPVEGGGGGGSCYALLLLRTVSAQLPPLLGAAAAEVASTGSGRGGGGGGSALGSQRRWEELLWLLWVARELALSWPALLHPWQAEASTTGSTPAAGGAQQQQQQRRQHEQAAQAAEAGLLWQDVWHAAVSFVGRLDPGSGDARLHTPLSHRQQHGGGFGLLAAVRDAAAWQLQAQLSGRLMPPGTSGSLNRPALAARLAPLWSPPLNDAAAGLLATLAAGEQLAGAGRGEGELREALVAACVRTIAEGGPGGSSMLALSAGAAAGGPTPVLAALHALLGAPPALSGAALHELACDSGNGDEGGNGGGRVDTGMLAARLLAQQGAWELGELPPSVLQSPALAAEVSASFAGGSPVAAAFVAAGGAGANGAWDASAGGGPCYSSGVVGACSAVCDWWVPDGESALMERQLSALEPAEQLLGRRLEAARAAALASKVPAATAATNSGVAGDGLSGALGSAAWWETAVKAARLLIGSLQEVSARLRAPPAGSAFSMTEQAAAALKGAAVAAAAELARLHLLPLLQLATAAAALCSAAAAVAPPPPRSPQAALRSGRDGGAAGSADAMDVDGDGQQGPGAGATEADPQDLLGKQLCFAVASALACAGGSFEALLPDPSAFYRGSPALRQLSQLSAELGRLARLRPELSGALAHAAVLDVAQHMEEAARGAATAASAAAEASAARYVRSNTFSAAEAGFDDDLDFGRVPSFKRPASTPAVLTTHPSTNAAAAAQATQAAAAAAAAAVAAGGLQGPRGAALGSSGLFSGKTYGGAPGVEGAALRVLCALTAASGHVVADSVLRLWQLVHKLSGAAPSEQLLEEMADAMVAAVCSGAWSQARSAIMMLDQRHGLLRGKAHPATSVNAVLALVCRLAATAVASDVRELLSGRQQRAEGEGLGYEEEEEAEETTMHLLTALMDRAYEHAAALQHAEQTNPPHDFGPDHARLQQGRTVAAMILLDVRLFSTSNSDLGHLGPFFKRLLYDGNYAVRAAAGQLLSALLLVAQDPRHFFRTELLQHLPLTLPQELQLTGGAHGHSGDPLAVTWSSVADSISMAASAPHLGPQEVVSWLAPYWETGVLQLTDMALAAPRVAGQALLLMCGHSMSAQAAVEEHGLQERVLQLSAASAELLAACSRYTEGRTQSSLYHGPCLAWDWLVTHKLDLHQLLTVRHVLAAPKECTSALIHNIDAVVSEPDFAGLLAPSLLPALVARGDARGLQTCSRLLGHRSPSEMLETRFAGAFGPLLALQCHPPCRELVAEALKGQVVAALAPRGQQDKLLPQHLRAVATSVLCSAALGARMAPLPGFQQQQQQQQQQAASCVSPDAVLAAVPGCMIDPDPPLVPPVTANVFLQLARAGPVNDQFDRDVLGPPHLPCVLLEVHRHVLSAALPAHRAARLGALHALLLLLGGAAAAAGCARHICTVLLQLVPEPEVQPVACKLLQALFLHLLSGAEAAPDGAARATAVALLGALLQDCVGVLAAAVEARLQRGRRHGARRRAQGIVAAIGAAPPAGAGAGPDMLPCDPAASLLGWLLGSLGVLPEGPLRGYLRALDPLPALPSLSGAAAALRAAREGVTLAEEIATFAGRAGGMSPAGRRRAAALLKGRLERDEEELLLPHGPSPGRGAEGAGQRLLPEVAEAAWRLAHLGARLDDPALSGLAARLLAAAGPLPPDVIRFSPAASEAVSGSGGGGGVIYLAAASDEEAGGGTSAGSSSSAAALSRRSGSAGGGGAVGGGGGGGAAARQPQSSPSVTGDVRRDAMLSDALQILGSFLTWPDPEVTGVVQEACQALLATREGWGAQQQLKATLEATQAASDPGDTVAAVRSLLPHYLVALRPAPASGAGSAGSGSREGTPAAAPPGAAPAGAPADVTDDSLWSPAGAPHGVWLCRLAPALLSACRRDRVLSLLAPAAALLPALAESLLPHALRELVGAGAGGYDSGGYGSSEEDDDDDGEDDRGRSNSVTPAQAKKEIGAAMEAALAAGAAAAAGSPGAAEGGAAAGAAAAGGQPAWQASRGGSSGLSIDARLLRSGSWGPACGGGIGGSFGSGPGTGAASAGDVKRSLRVLLACLEFLRGVHRDAMLTAKGRPPTDPLHPYHWSTAYALQTRYLTAARAADACSAHFTALVYSELWCERRFGHVALPGAAALIGAGDKHAAEAAAAAAAGTAGKRKGGRAGAVAAAAAGAAAVAAAEGMPASEDQGLSEVEALLLDLYERINDPDGIYAIAALIDSSRARLHLQQHEGRWAEVLAATDQRLQHPEAARGATETGGACVSDLLRALQHMGCRHTAQRYLLAAAAAGGAVGHALSAHGAAAREAHAQLAWQLGNWGDAPAAEAGAKPAGAPGSAAAVPGAPGEAPLGPSSGADGGFQSSILRSLQLLRSGDGEAFAAELSEASHATVAALASSGDESALTVNRALVRLQMLELLQKAWGIKWASRGGGRPPSSPAAVTVTAGAAPDPTSQLLRKLLGPLSAPLSDAEAPAPLESVAGSVPSSVLQLRRRDYHRADQLLTLQSCIVQILGRPDALALTLQASGSIARRAGHLEAAGAALSRVGQLVRGNDGPPGGPAAAAGARGAPGGAAPDEWRRRMARPDAPWLLEAGKLMWDRGQATAALREIDGLIAAAEKLLDSGGDGGGGGAGTGRARLQQHLARLLSLAGKWRAATQRGGGKTAAVMELMARSADAVSDGGGGGAGGGKLACDVYFRFASFADERYKQTLQQMNSPEFRTQQLVIAAKRRQVDAYRSRMEGPGANDTVRNWCNHTISGLRKVISADEEDTQQLQDLAKKTLRIALQNYGRALQAGGSHDLAAVYRLCQLWLSLSEDPDVNRRVREVVEAAPSAKFVPLVYQIASRMSARSASGAHGDAQKAFQRTLFRALERMALDHPYHALYSLIALRNGDLDKDGRPLTSRAAGAGLTRQDYDTDKVAAATALLAHLAKNPRRTELQRQIEAAVGCFVELAATHLPVDKMKQPIPEKWVFPAALKRRLQSLSLVPIPTMPIPVDPSGAYPDVPTLHEVESRVGHAGGINAPKVVRAIDSHGYAHRLLVKSGNDDLRQDAVMQQFFGLIDNMLATTPEAAARHLGMGTYRVVPISPGAGLVQWVENTVPMTDYLLGRSRRSGAHARYRSPGEWSWIECHNKLKGSPAAQQLPVFLDILSHFRPVFHHFFLEAFRAPAAWFEARTTYTRSIAVGSMAGFVIGLGDRHMGNLLLDKSSAAVLQIDLGVAFEQGRFLITPELVPFRLTRDVVDGMGAFGVEGPMRRCCEETMRVLRRHKEALLTVVEVVLHDPLYRWQMNPVKAHRKQQDIAVADAASDDPDSTGGANEGAEAIGNADAARAVLRVKQKLEGVAGGEGEPLSVAAQVDALLAEAQDPELLCRMFPGWSPWM